ncbi:MAG TPA: efflux RND transporter periplasmic adaptor subunit [Caulobacteraceae bacterium]|jgi:multidrug efflux system membrane fusion protein|nr:efflux RND transporter periplasmic adaptor subunit [Caulobacteraceae bacterium]
MPTDDASRPRARVAPDAPRPSRRALTIAGVIALALAFVIVILGIAGRASQTGKIRSWTTAQAIPVVSLVTPTAEIADRMLVYPGTLQAYYSASIFARVPGYLHAWYTDIGAHVKTGQLLATIDTPELDAELIQAKANLATAVANRNLAEITANRWSGLLKEDAVSRQESDEKAGAFEATTAEVNAAQANVGRLQAMKAFARIVAPFNGVVTARRTDVGALINPGAGSTTTTELFDVAQVNPLRLYVNVPQADSAGIRPGITASLTVPEYPGQVFPAKLATTSESISATSGTVLVELQVDNSQGLLKVGDYAQVKFVVPPRPDIRQGGVLQVPSSALLFRKIGTQLALLGPGDRVRLARVTVGRDLGQTIEITSGLQPNDRVIDNPPDSIANGELVRVGGATPARKATGANAEG